MNCYIMTRNGVYTPYMETSNQCKETGHLKYHYKVCTIFAPEAKLNHKQFLLDHIKIDEEIQQLFLSGSCESMAKNIVYALQTMYLGKELPVIAIKATILPDIPIGQAYLSFLYLAKKEDAIFLTLMDS